MGGLDPSGLDTPVLTIDLDRAEANIARMQAYCDEHGLDLRPHIKTHKLPSIAALQLGAGAVGIACQKLGEAEVMAHAGVEDITITYPLVGEAKMRRLVALAREARISVVGDSATVVEGLSAALGPAGLELEFLVECDTGMGRAGVQTPRDAADLAALADRSPGLRFGGLMTFPTSAGAGPWLAEARSLIEAAGMSVGRVSGGGTPFAFHTHEVPVITEVRVGTYVYGDRSCVANETVSLESCAAFLRATVVSRPTRERAILDSGSKSLSSDPTVSADETGFGYVLEHPEAVIYGFSEEHGNADVSACARQPEVGEVVSILPNHVCSTVNMHNSVLLHRGDRRVGIVPVAARGRVS